MKKIKLCLLLGSLMLLTACSASSDPIDVADRPIAVTVKTAKLGSIVNSDQFSGRTQAATEISVTSEMAGIVEKVYVTIGQKVEKGDKLLSIKATDANKSVEQARAALELARTSYNNALGGSVNNQLNQLENAVALAQIGYDEAKRNYDMYILLYEAEGISEDQFKKVELSFTQATQQLSAATKSYETSKNETIPESQAMVKKQLDQAETAYKITASNLDKLTLSAPISGIITVINFSDNEMLSQAMPAFIISDINVLEANLQITEMDLGKFNVGDLVSVKLSDKVIEGKVKDVSRVTDSRTSLYTVNIGIDNSTYNLSAGMAVDIQLITEKSESAILVSKKALFEEQGKKYVYLCVNDLAVKTAIETGLSDSFVIEITQGVKEGDIVVIGGISLIKDGDNLFPVEKED